MDNLTTICTTHEWERRNVGWRGDADGQTHRFVDLWCKVCPEIRLHVDEGARTIVNVYHAR